MKNLLRIVLIVTMMASLTTEAKAQNKFGHINSTELLQQMPERDSAEQQLAAYAKTLETRMLTMQNEYRTNLAEYEEKQGTWSDLIKEEAA
ncbi:MAG: OmpH family outer membrane protein, partial [Bacteroidota bacterium]